MSGTKKKLSYLSLEERVPNAVMRIHGIVNAMLRRVYEETRLVEIRDRWYSLRFLVDCAKDKKKIA